MEKGDVDITKLYKKQISLTEWFESLHHEKTEILRAEDNEKRERMNVLNEIIGLPYDKPEKFSASDISNRSEKFVKFLEERGDELCALRLIPLEANLPKLRMRGKSVRDVITWFEEQNIDPEKYRADFVPHPDDPVWSSIFIINSKGIFGELIKGGHHQLTQGFHDGANQLIAFSSDFNEWDFSKENAEAKEHVKEILNALYVSDEKKGILKEKLKVDFNKNYLKGYFETVKSKEQGLWFVDYNRTLEKLYENLLPKINKSEVGVISGLVASRGRVSGKVKIISDSDLEHSSIKPDEILVCEMTTPEYFNIMQKSLGIITDSGGMLSHAGIIAREMGKPCIVGTENATSVLKDGDMIELDADSGVVRKLD